MKALICLAVVMLLLAGCGDNKPQLAPPPPKLLEPRREALDKAKGVEQTVDQQAEQQREDVDRQTQ